MESIREVMATLIDLQFIDYKNYAMGKGIPVDQSFYEATFLIANTNEKVIFQISALEASVLEINETGKLIYQINKHNHIIVSFSNKLKEVTK